MKEIVRGEVKWAFELEGSADPNPKKNCARSVQFLEFQWFLLGIVVYKFSGRVRSDTSTRLGIQSKHKHQYDQNEHHTT